MLGESWAGISNQNKKNSFFLRKAINQKVREKNLTTHTHTLPTTYTNMFFSFFTNYCELIKTLRYATIEHTKISRENKRLVHERSFSATINVIVMSA